MPIYEYTCKACGHRFSQLSRTVRSSAEGLFPPCPACQSGETQRLISSFAMHGPGGVDARETSAQNAAAQKHAAITPKEQISRWRGAKK